MKTSDIEILLETIKSPEYKLLLNKLPFNSFFSVQKWPTVQQKLNNYIVFMLYRSILMHSDLFVDLDKSFTMQIGKLHHLNSGSLAVGYVIELPKKIKLTVGQTIISATVGKILPAPTNVSEVPVAQHDFINKHLSIYMQNTSQLIACHSDRLNFLGS